MQHNPLISHLFAVELNHCYDKDFIVVLKVKKKIPKRNVSNSENMFLSPLIHVLSPLQNIAHAQKITSYRYCSFIPHTTKRVYCILKETLTQCKYLGELAGKIYRVSRLKNKKKQQKNNNNYIYIYI